MAYLLNEECVGFAVVWGVLGSNPFLPLHLGTESAPVTVAPPRVSCTQ